MLDVVFASDPRTACLILFLPNLQYSLLRFARQEIVALIKLVSAVSNQVNFNHQNSSVVATSLSNLQHLPD